MSWKTGLNSTIDYFCDKIIAIMVTNRTFTGDGKGGRIEKGNRLLTVCKPPLIHLPVTRCTRQRGTRLGRKCISSGGGRHCFGSQLVFPALLILYVLAVYNRNLIACPPVDHTSLSLWNDGT